MTKSYIQEKNSIPTLGIIDATGGYNEPHIIRSASIKSRREIGIRSFYSGILSDIPIVAVSSGWGKVAAATTAALLITHYHIDYLVLIGLCGRVNKEVHIGDIIVGSEYVHCDFDARPLYDRYEIPLLGASFFTSHDCLRHISKKASNLFLQDHSSEISHSLGREPRYHEGLIASTDQFLDSEEKVRLLAQDLPKALVVDMEGAAVAQVAYEYNVPFVGLKIVSDVSDHVAALDFHEFIQTSAKTYTSYLLNSFITILAQNKTKIIKMCSNAAVLCQKIDPDCPHV